MHISPGWQRVIAGTAILPAALALPVTAGFLDDRIDENLLLPAAAGGAAALGAGVGASLPAAFTSTGSRLRGAMWGAGAALGVATLATVGLFFAVGNR
jgi:hypothetical protein